MTSSAERAEAIVQRFNEGPRTGYAQAFDEIRNAQRDNPNFWREYGQRVNDGVNFRDLGFNTDFEVLGLNSRGQLITSDNNGTSQERRAANRLEVVGRSTAPAEGELWGNNGRRFQIDAEGRASFTVRQGDFLDHIARDVVAHNQGRTPTQQEILAARQAIARENNVRDVNNIPIGTTLRIPESLRNPNAGTENPRVDAPPPPVPREAGQPLPPREAAQPPGSPASQRGMRPEASRPAPDYGYYSPFAPPGVVDNPGPINQLSGAYPEGRNRNEQVRPVGNRDVRTYSREIGTWPIGTSVNVSEETNRTTGILERRTVNYPNADASFTVRTPNGGSENLQNVRSVEVVRDAATGQYTSTYTMRDGRVMRGVTAPDGSPRFWHPANQPPR